MYIVVCVILVLAFSWLIFQCVRDSLLAEYEKLGIHPQPCLTEAEYLALLPEIPPEIALGVREVLVDATGWDPDEIHPDTRLIEFELS